VIVCRLRSDGFRGLPSSFFSSEQLRHESSAPAMQHGERRRKMLAHLLRFRTHEKTGEDLEEEEEEGDDGEMQRSIHGRLMVSERLDRAAAKRGATEAQISNRSIETTQQCRQFTLQAIQVRRRRRRRTAG
jgi:hypothetical protein